MVSKTNQVLKNEDVLKFLTALFPNIVNLKDLGDGSIEIETDKFFTTASVMIVDNKFVVQTNLPESYLIDQDSAIIDYIDGFSYFYQLFNVNPFLFKFDKIRKVIYEEHSNMAIVKFMFDTSFGVSAFLSFSPKKSYLSLNGVVINLKKQESIDIHYNDIFSRFLAEKSVSELKVSGVEAYRINQFLIEEDIEPCNFIDEHLEIIKMVDF
jgi:hypothetical protein